MKKQECYITDPSGFVKLILWGSHTASVQQGSTYTFDKVRLREYQGEKYLNTPKQEEECTINLVEPFMEPLHATDVVNTTAELTATIIAVNNINKYQSCINCSKKVTIKGKRALCDSCKLTQKATACPIQWSFKLIVQCQQDPTSKTTLYVYGKNIVEKIFSLANVDEDATEDDLLDNLFEMDALLITYDRQSFKVVDIVEIGI